MATALDYLFERYAKSESRRTKTYWFCKEDTYGQRTGDIQSIDLHEHLVTVDRGGLLYYGSKFLYEDKHEAQRAALS